MSGTVVLVGASVRAMASSARAAGWQVIGIDLFGDVDLASSAKAIHVISFEEYPGGIESTLKRYGGLPVCYTGSLENNPELLERIAERGPLWGNGASIVRRVRDLHQLHAVLISHGFQVPQTQETSLNADPKKRWLVKSLRSAGGMQVRDWRGEELHEHEYLQQEINGKSCSALFIGQKGDARLLGVTRQILHRDLTSRADSGAERSFQYVGSIGPLLVDDKRRLQLEDLGHILANEFGLRGIFGVDWIDANGEVVVIEVNPRYVASAEVIEAAIGKSLFDYHVATFNASPPLPAINPPVSGETDLTGKLVVFAPWEGSVSRHAPCYQSKKTGIRHADIPPIGTLVPAGFPVLTLLTNGPEELPLFATLELAAKEFLREHFVPSDRM